MKAPKVRWRRIIRVLAALALVVSILALIADRTFGALATALGALIALIVSFIGEQSDPAESVRLSQDAPLYPVACGDKGLDLGQRRLQMSLAFGTYFTGLLEQDNSYIALKNQIALSSAPEQATREPIERIFWSLEHGGGPQVLIIAAEGGMGKSTLATKIVRCLVEQQAVDMILGDSAKTQQVNVVTGEITALAPAYYNTVTFVERLCTQVSLPFNRDQDDAQRMLSHIKDRLVGRRAVIVLDNLETVTDSDDLYRAVSSLASRDWRVIITTRKVAGLQSLEHNNRIVHLQPLTEAHDVQEFLAWHIRHYQPQYPELQQLEQDIPDLKRIRRLTQRTGGIPLLMQLVVSNVPRMSWDYVDRLPELFGHELLDYLYRERWAELSTLADDGELARQLLHLIVREQYQGKKVTLEHMAQWAQERRRSDRMSSAVRLLTERFLVVNHDPNRGNFAVFPSLAEFLQKQP